VASVEPRPNPAEPLPPPPPSYWSTARVVGWSTVAAGTLAGVGAVFFTLSAHDTHDRIQASVDSGEHVDYASLQAEQDRDVRWATALGITGGVLTVGGILVLLLAPSSHSGNAATARVYLQPGLVGASYAQRF
jgi:hypothetical protein